MKERPILFSTEMVQAILKGDKTQTRRVVKPQPDFRPPFLEWLKKDQLSWILEHCPYAVDQLWVRETWAPGPLDGTPEYYYRADSYDCPQVWPWKPSIHMPRKASRIQLEIINVRAERVQDISDDDADNEGVILPPLTWREDSITYDPDPWRNQFKKLWNSINAERGYGWDVNPWVWVIEFKRIKP